MNQHGYCPHCNADMDGELIYKHFMKYGADYEFAVKRASLYEGDGPPETRRWDRKIGISNWDSIVEYKCPDCGKTWSRK